jgi:hypothetical protein
MPLRIGAFVNATLAIDAIKHGKNQNKHFNHH